MIVEPASSTHMQTLEKTVEGKTHIFVCEEAFKGVTLPSLIVHSCSYQR